MNYPTQRVLGILVDRINDFYLYIKSYLLNSIYKEKVKKIFHSQQHISIHLFL